MLTTGKIGAKLSRLGNIRTAYTAPKTFDFDSQIGNRLTRPGKVKLSSVVKISKLKYTGKEGSKLSKLADIKLSFVPTPTNNIHYLSASNTLTFTQFLFIPTTVDFTGILGSYNSQLGNIELAYRGRLIYYTDAEQQLNFTQSVVKGNQHIVSASNILIFNDHIIRPIPLENRNIIIPQAQVVVVNSMIQIVVLAIPEQSITLPAPLFDDTDNYQGSKVTIKRSMSNVLYSYIRKNALRKLKYTFSIGRNKSLELEEFIKLAIGQVITLTNWKGEIWQVNITNNPIDFSPKSRYDPERERVEVTLEFQGTKTAG